MFSDFVFLEGLEVKNCVLGDYSLGLNNFKQKCGLTHRFAQYLRHSIGLNHFLFFFLYHHFLFCCDFIDVPGPFGGGLPDEVADFWSFLYTFLAVDGADSQRSWQFFGHFLGNNKGTISD